MRSISMLFAVLMFGGCNNYHLAKDYYYLPADESMDIGYPYGTIVYKSESQYSFGNPIVDSDVKECVSNNKYILVCQEPNKELFFKQLMDNLKDFNSYFIKTKKDTVFKLLYGSVSTKNIYELMNQNGNQANKIADSLIKNEAYYKKMFTNKFNYWIICVAKDSIIGPLNKDEYFIKRSEMNIPSSLTLKDVF